MPSVANPHLAQSAPFPWFRVLDPWLRFTAVWCLFSFKIFLVSFGEAGLRPDDLFILLALAGLVVTRRVLFTPISLPVRLYLLYAGVQFVSAAWNGLVVGRVAFLYSLVFVLRVLEYLVFYFIGYSLARAGFRYLRVATVYLCALAVLVPLQMAGLLPVPGAFGASRASGNTNGPYELAIVAGFLLCYVAYRKRSVLAGLVSLVLIVLTVSRIALVASLLSVLHFGLTRTRSRLTVAAMTVVLAVFGGGFYVALQSGALSGLGAFDRLSSNQSYSLADIPVVYNAAPVASNATEYFNGSFSDLNGLDVSTFEGDVSGIIRYTRWITLVKSDLAHVDSIVIGLGPSFGSAAVDGYYTRCFVETGVLGTVCFLAFLGSLLFGRRGSSWYFRDFVMIMAISALFIDIFLSYKSMMLLWLWHGMNQWQPRRELEAEPDAPAALAAVPA